SNLTLVLPLLVGGALMYGAGCLLEALSARRKLWLVTWLVAGVATYVFSLAQFESIEHAVAKNGSLGAYMAFSSQLETYVATVLALLVAAVHQWFRTVADDQPTTAAS
ncbi:MAG: hypothetical protein ACI9S9_003066, partial [Planctomycetota bacterium]